ncbi:hypothetical protein HOD88_03190 [archaeon]|jgi:ABC-type enterochelin transport system permease subunit|nr:hypothetical protein [archaeon]
MKRGKGRNIFYALIIGIAVVSFWRGVWGIMDVLIYPNNYLISSLISFFIGIIILFFTKHLIKELI